MCRKEHSQLPVQAFKARIAHIEAKNGMLYLLDFAILYNAQYVLFHGQGGREGVRENQPT